MDGLKKVTPALLKQIAPEIEKLTGSPICITQTPKSLSRSHYPFSISIFTIGSNHEAAKNRQAAQKLLTERLREKGMYGGVDWLIFGPPQQVIGHLKEPDHLKRYMNRLTGSPGFFFGKPLYGASIREEIVSKAGRERLLEARKREQARIAKIHAEQRRMAKGDRAAFKRSQTLVKPETGDLTQESIKPLKGLAIQQLLHMLGHAPRTATIRPAKRKILPVIMGYGGPSGVLKEVHENPKSMTLDRSVKMDLTPENELERALERLPRKEQEDVARQLGRLAGFMHKNGLRHGDMYMGQNVFVVRVPTARGTRPQVIVKDFETAGLTASPKARYKPVGNIPYLLRAPTVKGMGMKSTNLMEMHASPHFSNEDAPNILASNELDTLIGELKEDTAIARRMRGLREETKKKLLGKFNAAYERELVGSPLAFKGKPLSFWARNNPLAKMARKSRQLKHHVR